MSALVLPRYAPEATREAVVTALVACPPLVRLLDTPGLLAAVALESSYRPDRGEWLLHAAATPHRLLAAELRLPGLGVLRRLTGGALGEEELAALVELDGDPFAQRVLRHARQVTRTLVLSLAGWRTRFHAAPSFFGDLANSPPRDHPRVERLFALVDFLIEYLPDTRLVSLGHYYRLDAQHSEILRRDRARRRSTPAFPPPPWPGEPGYAEPLRSQRDLIAESVAMGNCTGRMPRFTSQVLRGARYFYRVEGAWGLPRATLLVGRSAESGRWSIVELRTHGNREVRGAAREAVQTWVEMQQRDAWMPAAPKQSHSGRSRYET